MKPTTPRTRPTPTKGLHVEIYRNLHKGSKEAPVYSIRDKGTRLVIGHCHTIVLGDVKFKVSEKGRQRVLATKRKNVHATICGMIIAFDIKDILFTDFSKWFAVRYNPYKYSTFVVDSNEEAIYNTNYAVVNNKGITAIK